MNEAFLNLSLRENNCSYYKIWPCNVYTIVFYAVIQVLFHVSHYCFVVNNNPKSDVFFKQYSHT